MRRWFEEHRCQLYSIIIVIPYLGDAPSRQFFFGIFAQKTGFHLLNRKYRLSIGKFVKKTRTGSLEYYEFQLMGDLLTLESGQNVQLTVERAIKPEREPALTLLQPMVVQIVLGKRLRLKRAIMLTVQVIITVISPNLPLISTLTI